MDVFFSPDTTTPEPQKGGGPSTFKNPFCRLQMAHSFQGTLVAFVTNEWERVRYAGGPSFLLQRFAFTLQR